MKRSLGTALGIVVVAGILAFTSTTIATARQEDEILARGHCNETSKYALAMARDIGIEMELEVVSGVPGQTWLVEMVYNRVTFFRGIEETEEDGGFSVKKQPRNEEGDDTFTARAFHLGGGESCEGSLTAPL